MNTFQITNNLQALHMKLLKLVMARYREMGVDITPVQGKIILALYHTEEAFCQTDIQNCMSCNKSTLSSILDTTERNGLIIRKESRDDSRKKLILLTSLSKELVEKVEQDRIYVEKKLCEGITEEECVFLNDILEKMQRNLERMIR